MGKIKVSGYASKKIEVDECTYTIRFSHTDIYESEAIRRVKENSEEFLRKLQEKNFDISKVHMSDDSILRGGTNKTCSRELKIKTDASVKTNNFMFSIVKDNKIEAAITTAYSYSKTAELHKELLAEAVKDSKQKAEIIASASDSKVLNIDYMSFDRYEYDDEDEDYDIICDRSIKYEPNNISDVIANKENYESEQVYITWNIK